MKYLIILIWFLLSLFSPKVYSQNSLKNTDNRYITEPRRDYFIDEFNDFNKIKSVKIEDYRTNSKMKFIGFTGNATIIIENKYPYIYQYSTSLYTPDTLSTFVFKYHNDTLEYAKLSYLQQYGDKKLENTTVWNYNEDGNISSKENFIDNQLTKSTHWIYNQDRQLIRVNIIANYKGEPSTRSFYHYIYNQSNQLIERIVIVNDEIQELKKWGYTNEGDFYEINPAPQEWCGGLSNNGRPIHIKEDDFNYIYDKHKNWIKKIRQINDEIISVTERKIIYK